MKETLTAFRNAVGGYNKQDVNNYIANLCENYATDKNNYETQIAQLNEQLDELKKRCEISDGSHGETGRLKDELDRANSVVAAQAEKLESQNTQLESLRAKLAEQSSELEDANEKLSLNAETEEKLKKYDRMTAKVGELIIEAASSAELIKSEAKIRADETLRSSEEHARQMRERENELACTLKERYKSAVTAVNAKLTAIAREGMDSITSSLQSAQDEIDGVLERQRASMREVATYTAEKLPELEQLANITGEK